MTGALAVCALAGVLAAPHIDSLAPASGGTDGGARVAILGSGFRSTDEVVIDGTGIVSPPGDVCLDGLPMCSGSQCVLSQARGLCTICGTPDYQVFRFFGSEIIVMPNVGPGGVGAVDVSVRDSSGMGSNIVQFTYTPGTGEPPPTITTVDPTPCRVPTAARPAGSS